MSPRWWRLLPQKDRSGFKSPSTARRCRCKARAHVRIVQDVQPVGANDGTMSNHRTYRRADPRYDSLRSGFNLAMKHRPDAIVDAASAEDIIHTD
jgi:hypothetical protein